MSPSAASVLDECDRFPRVSGDEPPIDLAASRRSPFSPREWG